MAYAGLSPAAELVSQNAGRLLDEIDYRVQAGNALEAGGPDGLVRTVGYVPEKDRVDTVGEFIPGADRVEDIAIAETYASKRPHAFKGRGAQSPHKLHVLVEQADRYLGATGTEGLSLDRLARFTLAVTADATERVRAQMQTVVVNDAVQAGKARPLIVDEPIPEALFTLSRHDKFVAGEFRAKRGRAKPNTKSALAEGLGLFTDSEEGPRAKNHACLVVSDFIMGAIRDAEGNILGFDWVTPLRILEARLGDRLFVVRLTTPAHTELPIAPKFSIAGKAVDFDEGELLASQERYRRAGQDKATRISAILSRVRHLDLDSQTTTPFSDVANFIFGTPPEHR